MKNNYKLHWSILALLIISLKSTAQLSGTYSVPATFSTLASAISSLNVGGITGSVTILVDAGYTETSPAGGYTLTASGNSTASITFQKNGAGANPLITAYTGGTSTPASAFQDGVFRIVGSDYIIFDGIDVVDPNGANPATMEFGYGFFKTDAAGGCQFNTIRNCTITLNRINNALGTLPAADGSRGIELANATYTAHTTNVVVSAISGAHSFNSFYSNTIQNCNTGISLMGYAAPSPYSFADNGNDVGGASGITGNNIVNFGGGAGATNPAVGVRTLNQYSLNVSFNTINSNTGAGVNHPNVLRGILLGAATSANLAVNSNTITLKSGGTTQLQTSIDNAAGSVAASNAVSISNNVITNCTYASATSGVFTGIINSASAATLNISNNTFSANATNATSGIHQMISNTGAVASVININNNLFSGFTFSSSLSGTFYQITNTAGLNTCTLSISNNSIQAITHNLTGSLSHLFIRNSAGVVNKTFSNNQFINLVLATTGGVNFIDDNVTMPAGGVLTVSNNSITGTFSKTGAGGTVYLYFSSGSWFSPTGATKNHTNNNFSNITLTGATTMNGYVDQDGAPGPLKNITGNIFNNWICGSGSVFGIQTTWSGANTIISSNSLTAISGSAAVTGISIGASAATGNETVTANYIVGLSSTGGAVNGIMGGSSSITNLTISNNTIAAISGSGAAVSNGINSTSGSSMTIFKNKIYDIQATNASGTANGIVLAVGTTSVYNNIIGDIRTPNANAAFPLHGINITGGTTHRLYYNTVRLNATSAGVNFGSAAVFASTFPNVYFMNNIFINLSTPNGTGLTVAYRRSSTTLTTYSATSNNNLFYAGTPGVSNLIFYDGTNALQTMATYQPFVSPRDGASVTENTSFISLVGSSPSFLHVVTTGGTLAESGAVNISGITDDFDNNVRFGNIGYTGSGTAPDIGADEFETVLPPCSSVTAANVAPPSPSICANQSLTLNSTGFTTGSGIVYQWQVGTTPGGPYTNVVGGFGGNSVTYQTPTLGVGNYYYVMLTTCTLSGQFSLSVNESTVSVNPYPSVSVSPVSSTICVPGGSSVTLNASGAVSYSWGPASGLSSTVGAQVDALPPSTTVYTLTGANGAGCTATTTATVQISAMPAASVTASPTLICPGSSSSLTAVGTLSIYGLSNISYSPVPTPTVGVTQLCNNGVVVVPPTDIVFGPLDDVGWANNPIPFTFMFYGQPYNSFGICSNGFIYLGSGFPDVQGYGSAFPSPFAANPAVGAIYGDLDFNSVGTIETFTTGVAPNRQLVVNWTSGAYYFSGGTITAQAVLFETSNVIEVHVFQNTASGNAVEGIQNFGGNAATVVSGRNNQAWPVSTPDANRWTPGSVTYTWNPGTFLNATNIPTPVATNFTQTTTYSVDIVGNNGCTNTKTITLTADIAPTVAIAGGTLPVCAGTTVNMTASGADTYSWSSGPTTSTVAEVPLVTTTYTVVGTSSVNGCTDDEVQTVTVNPTPTITVSGATAICVGQSATLIALGAQNYTWTNDGSLFSIIVPNPTATTVYTVVGTTSAGCSSISEKTLTVYALPQVSVTAAPSNTVCIDRSATLIASGLGVDGYQWSNGGNGAVTQVTPGVTTTYTVIVNNNFTGCTNSQVLTIFVDPCTGLEEQNSRINGLGVYPNPNTGEFTIELNNGAEKTFEIYDVTGRLVYADKVAADKIRVNINELAKGIYYVKIKSLNEFEVVKLIKQ